MRTVKEIALDLNKDYHVAYYPYTIPVQDGSQVDTQEIVFDNLYGTELHVVDVSINWELAGYMYSFVDVDTSYHLDTDAVYSEKELEDIINGFLG